jgi:hypothetical protein
MHAHPLFLCACSTDRAFLSQSLSHVKSLLCAWPLWLISTSHIVSWPSHVISFQALVSSALFYSCIRFCTFFSLVISGQMEWSQGHLLSAGQITRLHCCRRNRRFIGFIWNPVVYKRPRFSSLIQFFLSSDMVYTSLFTLTFSTFIFSSHSSLSVLILVSFNNILAFPVLYYLYINPVHPLS